MEILNLQKKCWEEITAILKISANLYLEKMNLNGKNVD